MNVCCNGINGSKYVKKNKKLYILSRFLNKIEKNTVSMKKKSKFLNKKKINSYYKYVKSVIIVKRYELQLSFFAVLFFKFQQSKIMFCKILDILKRGEKQGEYGFQDPLKSFVVHSK